MDSPFLLGVMAFSAVWVTGYAFSRWSWSRPLAAAGAIALIVVTGLGPFLR
jgi:hypothetical protein